MSKKGPKKVVPKWLQDYRDGKPRFVVEENSCGIFTCASSEEVAAEHKSADTATASESGKVEVFTAGSLMASVKQLAAMAEQARDDAQRQSLCTGVLLTAAAALEAFLAEYAYTTCPALYTREFRRAGVPGKYQALTGNALKVDFPDVEELGGVPPLLPTAVFTGNVQLPASGNPGNPALDNNGGTPPGTLGVPKCDKPFRAGERPFAVCRREAERTECPLGRDDRGYVRATPPGGSGPRMVSGPRN
jgi:hypothetical protein